MATIMDAVPCRFAPSQLELLDQARERLALTRSAFVRMAVVLTARAALAPGEPQHYDVGRAEVET